ncbi:5339_t:CDS:1, partial [Ambispora leptoticha]
PMASASNAYIHQKGSSPVWQWFDCPVEESGMRKAKYQLCVEDKYIVISNNGTTNLRNHITKVHIINISEAASLDFASWPGEHILREALVKWIAMDCLPFTSIESESF